MNALSIGRAVLLVGVIASSACGEPPTTPPPELASSTASLAFCEVDTDPPVLSIQSQELVYECTGFEAGNNWQAPDATATDACEGSIPVHRYNTGDDDQDGVPGMVDPDDFGPGPTTEAEGLYYVQYLAWDSSFNIAGAILDVYVKDTLAPLLTLNGPEYTQLECFRPRPAPFPEDPNPYIDPGVSVSDLCYGELQDRVVTYGEVNKQLPGLYTLTYHVSDLAYNQAVPVSRTVEVVDTLPPAVTVQSPIALTPRDGTLRTKQLSECVELNDQCDGLVPAFTNCGVTSITSDEPGEDAGDILFEEGGGTFSLRAEASSSGDGRQYTVSFVCSDSSGNSTQGECTFDVPVSP
jgi:hypothetical protein